MTLNDKIVAVTGGANGIGKALCKRFIAEGAKAVAVVDLEAGPAEKLADEIGGIAYAADVSKEADLQALVADLEQRFGQIDLFCSNAGIGFGNPPGGHAASQDNQQWQSIWEVNVMAHVYAARAALPGMLKRGSGYFLNTASAAGLLSQIDDASYSTTKHAAIGFAESLAISHGDQGISVSVLCPQAVATRMIGMEDPDDEAAGFGGNDVDGVLKPDAVAESVIRGLAAESFLILPHQQVETYMQRKVSDYDRWLGGMRRLRGKVTGT
jgi:NAD(P)-dependent dehydrogenase (short-subunit alcohol dehydrogenase family)